MRENETESQDDRDDRQALSGDRKGRKDKHDKSTKQFEPPSRGRRSQNIHSDWSLPLDLISSYERFALITGLSINAIKNKVYRMDLPSVKVGGSRYINIVRLREKLSQAEDF